MSTTGNRVACSAARRLGLLLVVCGAFAGCRVEGSSTAPKDASASEPREKPIEPSEPSEPSEPIMEAPESDAPGASRGPEEPVAAVEPPWREQDWPRIAKVQPLVKAASAEHGVDPHLVNAIIWHESKFHPKAKGRGGSAGLMQLMPSTSRALARQLKRPHRPYDVQFNVEVGTYLLARLLKKFDGDERLALAGYGLGSGRVRGLLERGEPLPERTERFIAKVQRWRLAFARADADGRAS